MNPEGIRKKIKLIRRIHYVLFTLFFVCIYLVIFSPTLGVYGALAICSMAVVQIRNKGECSLTLEEHRARKKLGENTYERFIEGVFKQHFNITIPRFVINVIIIISVALSVLRVFQYLLNIFRGI